MLPVWLSGNQRHEQNGCYTLWNGIKKHGRKAVLFCMRLDVVLCGYLWYNRGRKKYGGTRYEAYDNYLYRTEIRDADDA